MKKFIKAISLALTAVMVVSALAGCGGKAVKTGGSVEKATENTGAKTEDGKPIIRYFMPNDPGSEFSSDSWSILKWGEKTDTKIEIQSIQRDVFNEKLAALLASNDLPEYINYRNDENTTTKYGDKLFVAYEDYKEEMPNLTKWLEKYPEVWEKGKRLQDDKMYGFPRILDFVSFNSMWTIREDLLNQAGMTAKDIVTIDDLKEALLAIKTVSGQPYVTSSRMGWWYFAEMTGWFFGTSPYMMFDNRRSDGTNTWIYGPTNDMYKEWVKFYAWAYENKVLHPNFLTMTEQELTAGYGDGKFQLSMEQAAMGCGTLGAYSDKYPERKELPIYPVEINGERAKQPRMHHQNNGSRFPMSVTKASGNVPAAIKALDWLYSEEGHVLTVNGEEGTHWVADDNYIGGKCSLLKGSYYQTQRLKNGEITQEEYDALLEGNKVGLSSAWLQPVMSEVQRFGGPCKDDALGYQKTQDKIANINYWVEQGYVTDPDPEPKFTEDELTEIVDLTTILETYTSEQTTKFITGELDIEKDWDNFQKEIKNLGSDKLVKLYNDRYKEQYKK